MGGGTKFRTTTIEKTNEPISTKAATSKNRLEVGRRINGWILSSPLPYWKRFEGLTEKKKAAVKPLYLVCHRPPPYSGVFRHDLPYPSSSVLSPGAPPESHAL